MELAQDIEVFLTKASEDQFCFPSNMFGYFPDDIGLLMADAAISVLKASTYGQEKLREEESIG